MLAQRMAELQRESQRRRDEAYLGKGGSKHASHGAVQESKPVPTAAQVGAARAAAKMGGGIFYTYDEHSSLLERMRVLKREVETLQEENAALKATASTLAAQQETPSPVGGRRRNRPSFSSDALNGGAHRGGASPSRSRDRSPGVVASCRPPAVAAPTECEQTAAQLLAPRGEPVDISAELESKASRPSVFAEEVEVQVERDRSTGSNRSGRGSGMLSAVAAAAATAAVNLGASLKGVAGSGSRGATPIVGRPPNSSHPIPLTWLSAATA